ncbi:hypothetical protein [Paenibacillus tepidiphilus]|uniref:hypothetical protein n=1 Tax=Paenibacillus tepidiphilus TaxID=2608683 RepID=UPI00123AA1E4|nr:hypothetical protein [Paenibacillus tepidiphilus]
MLLGSEYETLTKIAMNYTWHSVTGSFRFSESDYKLKFPDDVNLYYLNKIIAEGYANYSGNQIIVNTEPWINEFTRLIQNEASRKGFKYTFEYKMELNNIVVRLKDTEVFNFKVNFSDEIIDYNNTISFVYVPTFDSYLFWLDMLNDPVMFDMFLAFLNKQISAFNFGRRMKFTFFENLDLSYLSEIYNHSIPDYFCQANFVKGITSNEQWQWLMKYYLKEDLESYSLKKNQTEIIVCKLNGNIEFVSFDDEGNIYYSRTIQEEINKLESKLKDKVSSFRTINMYLNNKATDNARKISQIAGTLITPINLFILFGISPLGLTWMKDILNSIYSYIVIGILLFAIILGYVFWLVIPNIKLFRFSWKLEYH